MNPLDSPSPDEADALRGQVAGEGERSHAVPTGGPETDSPIPSLIDAYVASRRIRAAADASAANILYLLLSLALEDEDVRSSSTQSDLAVRELAAEIGAAAHESDRHVQRELDRAFDLVTRFPATLAALTNGRISAAHVSVIVDAGALLSDDAARAEYEGRIVEIAAAESSNRLRRFARSAAEELAPQSLQERHDVAAQARCVFVTDLDDGMARLSADLPATLAHGALDRLTRMGKAVIEQNPEDERTLAQVRADLLAELTLTGAPSGHDATELLGAIRAEVQVVVPILTLLNDDGTPSDGVEGVQHSPAMLEGRQPIDVATARRLAGSAAGWTRVMTDPISGISLAVDRYRPSAELRRSLRALDERCRFPGCAHLARRCDIDHVVDAAYGGPTSADNLSHLCRRHHVLKHHSRWEVEKARDGTVTWTSPYRRRYEDVGSPMVPRYSRSSPTGVQFVPVRDVRPRADAEGMTRTDPTARASQEDDPGPPAPF